MSLPLLGFPKIPTTRGHASAPDDWVASEKIHGAQLVLGTDGTEVAVGKRKAWLGTTDAFFGWQMIRPALHAAVAGIHAALGSTGHVWVYGELFGGSYPHPNVTAVIGLVPVQTGIWYAPDLRYAVFDIVHQPRGAEPMFLAHDRVQRLAGDAGLMTAPVLGRGRATDLDRLPVRYPSGVAQQLGLPELPNNVAEGYVLKLASEALVSERPCAKRKIPEFDEQHFDEASAFDQNAHLSREDLFALASRLINPARVASARSKVGLEPERVVEEVALDAMVDLSDLLPRRVQSLTPDEERDLTQHLLVQTRACVASE